MTRNSELTCYSGTISDADPAAHEHDTFDGVQEVRVNAHEERDVRQRPRRHDDDRLASDVTVTRRAGCFLPGANDRGGDGFDGGTTLVDTLPHWIRVGGRESLHAAEPIWTVDLRIVPHRPDERRCCATVHLDMRRSRERVQAPRGVYLGVLDGSVSVYLRIPRT